MAAPAIVLVNTQMPENIGAAARAMMNFGLNELRLVAPREPFPNKRAYDLAGNASAILDNAKLFDSTQEAVADRERVYASTARPREMVKPVYTPAEATTLMVQENIKAAILFGPERTGLSNEDTTIADGIITIPTAELASLNIAQSVVVIAYQYLQTEILSRERGGVLHDDLAGEISQSEIGGGAPPSISLNNKSPFVSKEELQGFLNRLEHKLDDADFWNVPEKKQKMWMNLQNIFTRANLTEQEVRTLQGVIRDLNKKP